MNGYKVISYAVSYDDEGRHERRVDEMNPEELDRMRSTWAENLRAAGYEITNRRA